MMSESDEAALLARMASDSAAICVLYDRHFGRLVAALIREGQDRELAFDLAQEAFARLLLAGDRIKIAPSGSVWPWLIAVGRNLLADSRRKNRAETSARQRLGIRSVPFEADAVADLIARVDSEALEAPLTAAFASLPVEQQVAIAAHVRNDVAYADLAEATGVSEELLRARVSRGLRALRLRLSGGSS